MKCLITPVCCAVLGMGLATLAPGPAQARQTQSPGNGGNGLAIGGNAPSASAGGTCVQVRIAGQKPSPYDCLNQQLQQQAQGTQGAPSVPPVTAASPSNETGTFNQQGIAEQYGKNFGKSVIPYRPPPPTYSSPLHTP